MGRKDGRDGDWKMTLEKKEKPLEFDGAASYIHMPSQEIKKPNWRNLKQFTEKYGASDIKTTIVFSRKGKIEQIWIYENDFMKLVSKELGL